MNTQKDNSIKTADVQHGQSDLSREEMLKQYRCLLTRVAKLKLKNIKVHLKIELADDHARFEVLVFSLKKVETAHMNNHFHFYDFWSIEEIGQKINAVWAALKSDDFVTVNDVFNEERSS